MKKYRARHYSIEIISASWSNGSTGLFLMIERTNERAKKMMTANDVHTKQGTNKNWMNYNEFRSRPNEFNLTVIENRLKTFGAFSLFVPKIVRVTRQSAHSAECVCLAIVWQHARHNLIGLSGYWVGNAPGMNCSIARTHDINGYVARCMCFGVWPQSIDSF